MKLLDQDNTILIYTEASSKHGLKDAGKHVSISLLTETCILYEIHICHLIQIKKNCFALMFWLVECSSQVFDFLLSFLYWCLQQLRFDFGTAMIVICHKYFFLWNILYSHICLNKFFSESVTLWIVRFYTIVGIWFFIILRKTRICF